LELLIGLGANVNVKNQIAGATPLHCAVQSNKAPEKRMQMVQLLVQKGKADLSLRDKLGALPLVYCREDDGNLMELLRPMTPPIFMAIQDKNVDQLESILREDPTAVVARYVLQTPLQLVVDQLLETYDMTQVQMLEILLKHGADPHKPSINHAVSKTPKQPLHNICKALRNAHCAFHDEAIQMLTKGAQILYDRGAHADKSTQEMLHEAASQGCIPFLDFLVTILKIDINTRDGQGMTPLHFAARTGQTIMVQHLLQTYPSLNRAAKDDQNQTPVDVAKANGKSEIVPLLDGWIMTVLGTINLPSCK
jgi:ankyrin repeat protein